MSYQQSSGRGRMSFQGIPHGDTIASFESYPEAQRAVDKLAAAEFPVKKVTIIGNGLTSVERITGKLSYGRAAANGAMSGAWLGLFFGLLLILINPQSDLIFVGAAVLIGAGFGMCFTMFTYGVNRKRRDFSSVAQIVASSYSVIVEPELANKARHELGVEQPPL
ncbi:general stress protein [Paramicrobacterium fandaimingii]|uniref:general stress protein n=1 Tax=Paramicrobacterium fandaimingii TaxID=2708079 RepID=UPI001F2DED4B|nr:general stress protein [Microbacterium fandaimingii]